MVEEKESRVDALEATASSPSTNAKTVKDDAKRVKNAKGASPTKKRPDEAKATDRTSAVEEAGAEYVPAVARAEEIMDRAGERVGQLLRSGQQLPRKIALAREALEDHQGEAEGTSADEQAGADLAPAVARAEDIMDRAGERVGQLLRAGSHQVQRGIALAREATEDLRAEAESIRRGERSSSN